MPNGSPLASHPSLRNLHRFAAGSAGEGGQDRIGSEFEMQNTSMPNCAQLAMPAAMGQQGPHEQNVTRPAEYG